MRISVLLCYIWRYTRPSSPYDFNIQYLWIVSTMIDHSRWQRKSIIEKPERNKTKNPKKKKKKNVNMFRTLPSKGFALAARHPVPSHAQPLQPRTHSHSKRVLPSSTFHLSANNDDTANQEVVASDKSPPNHESSSEGSPTTFHG